jgi:hypothetical protein
LLEPVYVGFSAPRTTNLDNGAPLSKIATSCRQWRRGFSVCVFQGPWREMA